MADKVLFKGGPLDGEVWVPPRNDPVVRVTHAPGEPDLVYEDTGERTEAGERIYEWDDR